jgi:hypothetical protein
MKVGMHLCSKQRQYHITQDEASTTLNDLRLSTQLRQVCCLAVWGMKVGMHLYISSVNTKLLKME